MDVNIPSHVLPIYAEEAKVNAGVKMNILKEDGKEIVQKQGRVEILFFENTTRSVISRIVIDPITAVQLSNILKQNAEAVMKEVDSKEVPQQVRDQVEQQQKAQSNQTISSQNYIG